MQSNEYQAARIQIFMQLTGLSPVDVYVPIGTEKYVKIFNKNEKIDRLRLTNYLKKSCDYFYFKKIDASLLIQSSQSIVDRILKAKSFNNDVAQKIIDDVAAQVLTHVFENKCFDESTSQIVSSLVSCYIEIAAQQPQVLPHLIRMARERPTLIRHGILSAIFATLLARAKTPHDLNFQKICGLSGLLHDIGLAYLPGSLDEHAIELSPAENQELRRHPQLGADCLNATSLPAGVRTAILQHHEAYDGSGYPMGLSGEVISLPARIVALVNIFVALTTGSVEFQAIPVEVALHMLANDVSIDSKLFKNFQQMLLVA